MIWQDPDGEPTSGGPGWDGAEDEATLVKLSRTHSALFDADALARVRRMMNETLTREQAWSEVTAKCGRALPDK